VYRALSGAPLSSDIPGFGGWPLALSRLVRDRNPERQFQSHARPVYLIKINISQFPFRIYQTRKLRTVNRSSNEALSLPPFVSSALDLPAGTGIGDQSRECVQG
jgi:hypothetical protein